MILREVLYGLLYFLLFLCIEGCLGYGVFGFVYEVGDLIGFWLNLWLFNEMSNFTWTYIIDWFLINHFEWICILFGGLIRVSSGYLIVYTLNLFIRI